MKPHQVAEENAAKILDWLNTRGGILIWKSQDLGNPTRSVTTPANQQCLNCQGRGEFPDHVECVVCKGAKVVQKDAPGWQFTKPDRHITSIDEVEITTSKVVDSFPIKLKRSGTKLVLTNASDARVRKALSRHGETSHYRFGATGTSQGSTVHALCEGGDTVEICIDDKAVPLRQWVEEQEKKLAANPQAS